MNFLKKSFSLIELLIFLSLLLIIVAVCVPRFDFFNKYLLSHDLDKLYMLFTYLHQKSIASNKKHVLTLDLAKNGFTYFSTTPVSEKLSEKISFGFIDGAMGPPASPTKKIEKPVYVERPINNTDRNTDNMIGFWPDGRITPGTLYLVDKAHKYMGALTCSVSQVSYIRRYRYENFRWKCLEN